MKENEGMDDTGLSEPRQDDACRDNRKKRGSENVRRCTSCEQRIKDGVLRRTPKGGTRSKERFPLERFYEKEVREK